MPTITNSLPNFSIVDTISFGFLTAEVPKIILSTPNSKRYFASENFLTPPPICRGMSENSTNFFIMDIFFWDPCFAPSKSTICNHFAPKSIHLLAISSKLFPKTFSFE